MSVENTTIQQLITAFLIIIPLGCAARIVMCAITMMYDEEHRAEITRRMKNAVLFLIFAECATGLIGVIHHYYS